MKHFADIITAKPCTPLQAIRMHCLECEGGPKGVRKCITTGCSLYEFRMGHRPKQTRDRDPATTERKRQIMASARAAMKVKRAMLNDQPSLF